MPTIRNNDSDFHKPLIINGTNYQTFNQADAPRCHWKAPEDVIDIWAEVQAGRAAKEPLYDGLGKGTSADRYPETRRQTREKLNKLFKSKGSHKAHL